MPVTLSAIPLDEHHSVAPLTTASRPWPPIVITALSDQLADLHNNRGRTFAYQEASCSSLQAAVKAWPPRSYTCSFCRREFSSAQGLGGHMNVHRRDRARLCRPSLPSSANIKDHNGAQQHLPPLTSHEPPASSDYPPSPLISLMYPVSRSAGDSLSCKLIFPTVPLLVTTSPFVSNSSSPALVSNPSTHISCPNDSTTSRSWRTLSPAVQAPQPPPPSPSLAASSPLIPLVGQANSAVDCLPSSHLDMKRCRPSSHHSTILLKSYSTRKKSIASFGFQPYRSFSFKNLDDSVHTLSGSDVEKGTIGLDLELRLGQSS